MVPPRFTLPTRLPSRPAARPAPRAQPKAATRPRRKTNARAAPQTTAPLAAPQDVLLLVPPPPILASVLSKRTARPPATIRRLEAGATGGTSPSDSLSTRGEGRGEARLLATSCAVSALVPPELRERLHREIGTRLARHFEAPQWEYPMWLSEQTAPMWGAHARRVFAGRGLRHMSLDDLRWLILYEAERLARILIEHPARHTLAERVVALRGALRRIGQVYRELRWRCGEQRALAQVDLALSALLWW